MTPTEIAALLRAAGYDVDAARIDAGKPLDEEMTDDSFYDFLYDVVAGSVEILDPDAPIPYELTAKAKAVEITAEGIRVG